MDLLVTIVGGLIIGVSVSAITVFAFGDAFHTSIPVIILFNLGGYLGAPTALWLIKKMKNIHLPYWRMVLYSLPGPFFAGIIILILQRIGILSNLTVLLSLTIPGFYTYFVCYKMKRAS